MTDLARWDLRSAEHGDARRAGRIVDSTEVAIIGAGPYGLSVAAHLADRGVLVRQFGRPMALWETGMPRGMFLKSQGFASNLSTPDGRRTLAEFCAASGHEYADYGRPVSVRTFLDYGRWFQRACAPEVHEAHVRRLSRADGGYRLALTDGTAVFARQVVVATGLGHFSYLPQTLAALPARLRTHSGSHADLGVFRDRRVIVVGGGQSALETAVLLAEAGSAVTLVSRAARLGWNGDPLPDRRCWRARLREPESGLGSGWSTWLYAERPRWFRRLPPSTRARRAATAMGPAGAWWLRSRFDSQVPALPGHTVTHARPRGDGLALTLAHTDGTRELCADHVIAATGYRPDLRRLSFIDDALRASVRTLGGGPRVGRDFESSAPGLYFVGPAVAASFGPVMRFVYGTEFTARVLADRLAGAIR
ncbi:MAG TPA: NAD(P)-binding domain-containing protein [Pseudonocardiaceae bacterium]|nr:NAD(P)-binding domain-containing protein [Pseudonocardiaceae bacterium]